MNQKILVNCAFKFMSITLRRNTTKVLVNGGSILQTSPYKTYPNISLYTRSYSTDDINKVQLMKLSEDQKKRMVMFGKFKKIEDVPDEVSNEFYESYLWIVRIRYMMVGIVCWFIGVLCLMLYWNKSKENEHHKLMHEQFTDYMSDKDKEAYLSQFEKKK